MLMLEMSQDIFPRPTHFSWWNLQAMHSCFTRCHSSQPYANFMSRILRDINCHGIFSCCRLMITWWHKDLDSLLSAPDCRLRTGWLTLLSFVVEARSSLPSWPPPPSPAPWKLYRRARIFWVWSKPSEDWRIRSPSSFSLSCPSQWNRSLVHAMRRERTQSSCGKRKKRKKGRRMNTFKATDILHGLSFGLVIVQVQFEHSLLQVKHASWETRRQLSSPH